MADETNEFMELSTKREDFPVRIDGQDYSLRVMTGAEIAKHRNSMGKRIKLGSDGKPQGFTNYDGMESSLITLCMFDASNKQVPMATIDSWPQPVISKLFEKCRKMNGLDEQSEKAEKKD